MTPEVAVLLHQYKSIQLKSLLLQTQERLTVGLSIVLDSTLSTYHFEYVSPKGWAMKIYFSSD